MNEVLNNLLINEEQNILNSISFMSYNPSIGRVLQKKGVKKFTFLVNKYLPELIVINTQEEYDIWHEKFVNNIINNIKTSSYRRASYGQAQKALNVFTKVYIDWMRRPNEIVVKKIDKYLHVPLDSIVMQRSMQLFDDDELFNQIVMKNMENNKACSLKKINKDTYQSWQYYFRTKYPNRPVVFDNIWAENR